MQEKNLKVFTNAEIEEIKEKYVEGTRIKLLHDIEDNNEIKAGDYGDVFYVDAEGTIHVEWDNGSTIGLIPEVDSFEIISAPQKIKVIYVEVGKEPVVKEIYNSLKSEQKEVGGLIECLPSLFSKEVDYDIVCNEEGKLLGLEANRYVYDKKDVIAGNFFVAKAKDGDHVSLTDVECNMIIDKIKELCPSAEEVKNYDKFLNCEFYMEDIDR